MGDLARRLTRVPLVRQAGTQCRVIFDFYGTPNLSASHSATAPFLAEPWVVLARLDPWSTSTVPRGPDRNARSAKCDHFRPVEKHPVLDPRAST